MRTNIITTIPRPMSLVKFNYKAWTSDKERAQYIPQYKRYLVMVHGYLLVNSPICLVTESMLINELALSLQATV